MELNKSAQEVLTQAQMLRLEAGMDKLCLEHVLYGLLLMASYKDEPMNDPELLTEAKEIRRELEKKMRSIASAKHQLYRDALHNNTLFLDATEAIGRASELAGNGNIGAAELLRAIWEAPTPAMRALAVLVNREYSEEDAKYREASQPQPQVKPEPHITRPPAKIDKPKENENKPDEEGPTTSQMVAMLKLLAGLQDSQQEELRRNSGKIKKNNRIKRKTKIGLFTYRGGTAAAAIQYFLFGILIPFAVLFALELLTGIVGAPPTPFVQFLVSTFIIFWFYYLLRGVARLVGLANNAFSHFLMLLSDLGLIAALAMNVCTVWQMEAAPVWLRIVTCLAAILVVLVGAVLFDHLRSEGDVTKTKIMFRNVEGTPAKIFFQNLTRQLMVPLLVFSVIWIFRIKVPVWLNKVLWIYAISWVWTNIGMIWNCIALRCVSSSRYHKGKKFAMFLRTAHIMLGPVAIVVFLHWLFAWFPMKTWVIILLAVYSLLSLIIAASSSKEY